MDILEQGIKEVSETGRLSFPVRRALWLALGPWEERDEMDESPRILSEPLKKRARLALDCAKKVAKVWAAYAPEDKGPQTLVKLANAYLGGKSTADKLSKAWEESDYINQTQDERYSAAPMAAIAAERAAAAALYDEFLLEPCYADADDTDLDPYDWDAAWCASLAWAGQNEDAGPGEWNVSEMKFWVWYLEQAAKLLGMEEWKFPRKAIKAFEEKQIPPRPVPEEVSLESLADFLGQGEYRFHCRIRRIPNTFNNGIFFDSEGYNYDIYTKCRKEEGVCPKCKTRVTKANLWCTENVLEVMLPENEVSIRVLHTLPLFHCPDHPDTSFTPREDYVNPKAALKRYIKGQGRLRALLNQLECRRENVFEIGESYLSLNGDVKYHHEIKIPAKLRGVRWLDSDAPDASEVPLDMERPDRSPDLTKTTEEKLEIVLKQFGPHVYFKYLTFDEFREAYPDRVEVLEDGWFQITMKRHWVRCRTDETGTLERVVIWSRFQMEVDIKSPITLVQFLMEEFRMPKTQAEEEIAEYCAKGYPPKEIGSFYNLTRAEALHLRSALRSKGIKCRVMPVPVGESADTRLR